MDFTKPAPLDLNGDVDLLSRNLVRKAEEDDDQMKDVVHTVGCGVDSLCMSEDRLRALREESERDPTLRQVKAWYQDGWPRSCAEQGELRHLYGLRSDITVEDGLAYLNDRLLVPKSCRRKMLELLHETHLGIDKTKNLARDMCYWPGMLSDVESFIGSCIICQTFSRSKQKESLSSSDIPEIPFLKVGVDIAEFQGKSYLVLYDYYSRWLEVNQIRGKSSAAIIEQLKQVFSRFGIPKTMICDNNPFGSYEFQVFAKEWGFEICPSSPYYPRGNGLAEKGVDIAKSMLKKSAETKVSFELFLLNYRNSPLTNLNISPAELLMNRRLRTKWPLQEDKLRPRLPDEDIQRKMKAGQERQKSWYDRTAARRSEGEFQEGEEVLIQHVITKRWSRAVIIKVLHPRSYLLRTSDGRTLRRNEIHIKKLFVPKRGRVV